MKKIITMTLAGCLSLPAISQTTALNHNWAHEIAPTSPVTSQGLCVTSNTTHVFSAGRFSGTIDIDGAGPIPSITAVGTSDMYVTCHDAAGTPLWLQHVSGAGVEIPRRMIVIGNAICIVGQFTGSTDFNLAGLPEM